MNFEKEAREKIDLLLAGAQSIDSDGTPSQVGPSADELRSVAVFLSKAFSSGEAVMLRRAKDSIENLVMPHEAKFRKSNNDRFAILLYHKVLDALRSLPLTPIEEEKYTPEFLPKASTKEVGIK